MNQTTFIKIFGKRSMKHCYCGLTYLRDLKMRPALLQFQSKILNLQVQKRMQWNNSFTMKIRFSMNTTALGLNYVVTYLHGGDS